MLIFDGDYPMAYGALELNRDLTLPIDEVRAAEERPDNMPYASLPEMRRGRVAAALVKFTLRRRPDSVLPGLRRAATTLPVRILPCSTSPTTSIISAN